MKTLLAATVLLLCGCASIQPTAVNPAVTYITNDLKAVTAAAGGDCTIPITAPGTTSLHTDCLPLDPSTTTVATNGTTYQACFGDAATAQLGNRVSAAAVGLQTALCAKVTTATAPVVVTPVPALGGTVPK